MNVFKQQYCGWFAPSGCQPTLQRMVNLWLISNNWTTIQIWPLMLSPPQATYTQFYSAPPCSLLPLDFLKSSSVTSEWSTTPTRWPFSVWRVPCPAALSHVDESQTNEDILLFFWFGGGKAMHWHSEISFGNSWWCPTHFQINRRSRWFISTLRACSRVDMTGDTGSSDKLGGCFDDDAQTDAVSVNLSAPFQFCDITK